MSRFLMLASVMLASCLGFAKPHIGDSANYIGSDSEGRYTLRVSLVAYDKSTNRCQQQTLLTRDDGADQISFQWQDADKGMFTDENGRAYVNHCTQHHGKIEFVNAGFKRLKTCRIISKATYMNANF